MTPAYKNRVGSLVSGTPGAGTITLSTADTAHQSFSAAYGADATVDILIEDGNDWEIARDCTYTHVGTTLTRGTLEASSTGSALSLTAAAKVYVVVSAARASAASLSAAAHIWFSSPYYAQRVSATSVKIAGAGEAMVNGELLAWASDLVWSGTSGIAPLALAGKVYGYLYNNAGAAALEVSTTAPEWDQTQRYWRKTSDSSRRCVWTGYVWATTAPAYRIMPFHALWQGASAEIYVDSEYVDASNTWDQNDIAVVSGGAATTPTSLSLPLVPVHATHWYTSAKITTGAANGDSALGISAATWSTSLTMANGCLEYTVRVASPAVSTTFFGRGWVSLLSAATAYYALQHFTGTQTATIECRGWRIPL